MDSLEQLACWAFECTRTELYLSSFQRDETKVNRFHKAAEQFRLGMPVQYITGETEFMGLKFCVAPSVFIPRPETEVLVEKTLRLLEDERIESPNILEIGTGSGAIAVSLTKYNPSCKIWACDISGEALKIARANANLNGVDGRIKFISSDLFCAISERKKFDLIISNPPYIPSEIYDTLEPQVKREPKIALDGGIKGLDFYKAIIPEGVKRLKPNGYLILEMGWSQSEEIRNLMEGTGACCVVEILKDHNGIDRVIFAKKRID